MTILDLPRIATLATMPTRIDGLRLVLRAIYPQVSRLFIYLDGHREVPGFLADYERVTIYRVHEVGALQSSSRFLCMQQIREPAVLLPVDDDIHYPDDYVERLSLALHRRNGDAVVGVHGRIFVPPHRSYTRDAHLYHFAESVPRPIEVHEVGAGTCAFVTDRLCFDPTRWHRHDMNDLMLSIEAQKLGLKRVIVPRPSGWLSPIAEHQPDSTWARALKDDDERPRHMRELISLYL